MKIIWSPRAKKDLCKIIDYIAKDKKMAALKWARNIQKKVLRLQQFPYSGVIVPELDRPEIREVIVGSYRVIYKVSGTISILTVFHGAKEWEKNLLVE